jgi:hypothetical protein
MLVQNSFTRQPPLFITGNDGYPTMQRYKHLGSVISVEIWEFLLVRVCA